MSGVEVFDGLDLQAMCGGLFLDCANFLKRPKPVLIAREAPAGIIAERLVAGRIGVRRTEIIHHVDDEVCAAALARELIVRRVELMPVESEAEFHDQRIYQKPMLAPPSTGSTTPVTNFAAGEQR